MNLKALRERDALLRAEEAKLSKDRADLGTKAVAEGRRMTDEERAAFAAFGPKIEQTQAAIAENAELLAAAEAANEAQRRIVVPASEPIVQTVADEMDKKAKAPGFFGRCLHAVRNIARHEASTEDHQLVKIMAGPTGANTDVGSDGGHLVGLDRATNVVERIYATGELAKLVTRQPIGATSNGVVLPAIDETSRADGSRYGGIVSTWVGQGTTVSPGRPKFRTMELKLKKILAFVYGTDELMMDAVAFESFVDRNLPLELTFRTEDAIVNGTGASMPLGFLNSGAAITVTRNTASRVIYDDVSGMWKRMWAPLRKTAVWLIDQSVEQDLEQLNIPIGTAGVLAPIYRPAGIAAGADGTQGYVPATLYGRPILTTEYGAALGTVGDIILVNPAEYTLIDKGGVEKAVSLHVAFLTDEACWRFAYRADGQLNWNAAMTPKSGGATVSALVTLT